FDPDFSDSPLLPVFPSYRLIRHIVWIHSAHAQRIFFLGRVHVISTGPISTVQTEVRGTASSQSRMKTPPTIFNMCSTGH
ncbi:unnamed protein product, partial [Staurois parvus]